MDEADAILMGGGTAISFDVEPPSPWHVGVVLKKEAQQQTEFGTGKPKFWDDGRKMMQVVVTLEVEPESDDDDGIRRLFVRGKNMTDAVRTAVRDAGAKTMEVGGKLGIQYTGNGEKKGGGNPPKEYRARYAPPAAEPVVDQPAPDPAEAPFTDDGPPDFEPDF